MPLFRSETPNDSARVDALYDAAFGPGRFAKTAERLREGAQQLWDASFVAIEDEQVIGAARAWALGVDGAPRAVFIGPVAVEEAARGSALGLQLAAHVLDAALQAEWGWAVLIGDAAYFAKVGFVVGDEGLVPPGSVPPGRLLVKSLGGNAPLTGALGPARL